MKKILFILAAMLLSSIGLHAGKTISYQSEEKLYGVGLLKLGALTFGPSITSHEYDIWTRRYVITCDGEITKIGASAFENCSTMTSIEIPNSVESIQFYAFENCTGLTSIEIPSSVEAIWGGAFRDCRNLTSIQFPSTIILLENDILEGCKALTSVTVGWTSAQSIVSIKSNLFQGIANGAGPAGATLYVPRGTVNLYREASVWKDFGRIIEYENSITYTAPDRLKGGYDGSLDEGAFTFGPKIIKHDFSNGVGTIICDGPITTIEEEAFYDCSSLTSVTIPISTLTIRERAFLGCTGLTSITIPASVKEIGLRAFRRCDQLKDLQFAERERTNPIKFGDYVFGHTALTAVDIPNWMTEIPVGLFSDNSKLETIYLPASVKKINDYSFENCPNIKYILSMSEIPPALGDTNIFTKNNKTIVYVPTPEAALAYKDSKWGEYFTLFYSDISYNRTSSRTVEVVNAIPAGGKVIVPPTVFYDGSYLKVTGIADSAFYDQDSLVSISLPSSIQYIGNNAFNGCTKLKDINIEFTEDLKTIGDKAFYNTALDTIVIPEGVQSLGRAAFAFNTLHYVSLPTGLKNIPDDCFRNCYFGTEIIVPEGVETIGENGFRVPTNFEKVTLITLPSTLKEIKNYAFENRSELKEVICLAQDPPTLGETIFTNKDTAVVYVPNRDVLKIYRESSLWKNYKFKFKDLMAEENKAYLYEVAGNNEDAKAIAQDYCDSIDNATSAQDVQQYTNIALGKIDGYTINDYKQKLADSLINYANGNAEAKQIAILYGQQILNAYFRQDAEQLFKEGQQKIDYIFDLIERKRDRKQDLMDHAKKDSDQDLIRVATEYGALIDRAETIEEVETLYIEGYNRITANRSIKTDWSGDKVKAKNDKLTCTTTPGYINH